MIALIDNYDSFTYNLYQYILEIRSDVIVFRKDKINLEDIIELDPSHIVISPGPCTPLEAGISTEIIKELSMNIPTLGVCLGHQCIGYVYGAKVSYAGEIKHGKTSSIHHDGKGLFKNIPTPFQGIRYHSLAVEKDTLPAELIVTAWTENDLVMGLRHKEYPIEGVQFHPESIMTEHGKQIISNFFEKYK